MGPLGSFFLASSGSDYFGALFSLSMNWFLNLSFFIRLPKFLASIATASSSLSEFSSDETLAFFLYALRAIVFAFLTGGREYSSIYIS